MTDSTAENQLERWLSPVQTMLGALTHKRVRANSITDVPPQLKESNVRAYKPKVVSIGPLHRKSTSRDLLYMEEIKWQCMLSLVHRTKEPTKRLTKCGDAILKYENAVRACYMDRIEMDSNELAKLMLLDGCFLLELLLNCNKEQLEGVEESTFPVKVGKREEFLPDLKLLENQIPLFIIDLLYIKLFVEELTQDCKTSTTEDKEKYHKKWDEISKKINGYVLFLFGCSSASSSEEYSPNRAHFLELTHWFLTGKDRVKKSLQAKREQERSAEAVELTIEPTDQEQEHLLGSPELPSVYSPSQEEQRESMEIRLQEWDGNDPAARCDKKVCQETKPKLERCAARLEDAGVKIKPFFCQSESSAERLQGYPASVMFGCKKKFGQGKLEIQSLHVTEETEVQWRNFIAWEQTKTNYEQTRTTEKKFSQYALLFKGLVCCEYDIKLLKSKGVLLVYDETKWSNEKLKKFIHEIAKGIQIDASADPEFCKMTEDLNEYERDRRNCGITIFEHHCGIFLTKIRKVLGDLRYTLKRDYTSTLWKKLAVAAATLLLLLTIAQTVLAAIGL